MSGYMWKGEMVQLGREIEWKRQEEQHKNAFSREDAGAIVRSFRQLFYWLAIGFKGVSRAFWNKDFLKLYVNDSKLAWKIDHRRGWAYQDGEVLDDLVYVEEDPTEKFQRPRQRTAYKMP